MTQSNTPDCHQKSPGVSKCTQIITILKLSLISQSMHFVVEDQLTVNVCVGLMFPGGSLQQSVLVLGVELLYAVDDAVGAEMVDVELQASHQVGVHVMETDGVVADTVLSLFGPLCIVFVEPTGVAASEVSLRIEAVKSGAAHGV